MGKINTIVLSVTALFFVGCGDLNQPENEQAIGGKVVVDLDGENIKNSLIAAKTPGVDVNTTVYGYKAYKIPYNTTDEEGNTVAVSGLMVIPKGLPNALVSAKGLSMVSDDHGTIFANADAPVVTAGTNNAPNGSPVLLTSLFGFVTLQPDYIGFGDSSEHYHPFVLKKSLANATVDFIIAAKKFALDNKINLNGQLFLTGYSEGGYAAMATLQKIEQEGNLHVTLAAPMAGPYALEAMAMKVLDSPTLSVPSFMADVGYAYAVAYEEDVASVINEPYASKLEGLLDGTKTRPEIDAELTTVTTGTSGLFNPQFVNNFFTDSNYWFKKATQENDLHNWVPQTAVRLVHCKGDNVIPYKISELTQGTMTALGATDVTLVPVEETLGLESLIGHSNCAQLGYGVTGRMFAKKRKETVGY